MMIDRTPNAKCARCKCPYGSYGFHDMIVSDDIWKQISPSYDDGGLLCPTGILAAMNDLGLKNVPVYFASGPAIISPTAEADNYCRLWVEAKGKLEQITDIIQANPEADDG